MLLNMPLDAITEANLQRLIGLEEGKQIEFKQTLPGKTDDEVKEFLKDVSALANTLGGDIYYGVKEDLDANGNTVASQIEGVSGVNADEEIRRLDSYIRDCIKPRLIGYNIKPKHLTNSRTVFIVRVPRSWTPPHVVDRQKHWRFYYRNSSGSHPMDVSEVRNAVLFADRISQRLEEVRIERLAKVAELDFPNKKGKVILHLQPIDSANPETQVDLAEMRKKQQLLQPISFRQSVDLDIRPNFDGLYVINEGRNELGYVQVFRSGFVEAVDADLLDRDDHKIPCLNIGLFENRLKDAVQRYLHWLNELGFISPVRLHLSLLGIGGYILSCGDTSRMGASPERDAIERFHLTVKDRPIQQTDLLFRGETLDSPESDPQPVIERWFDVIWNSVGLYKNELPYS